MAKVPYEDTLAVTRARSAPSTRAAPLPPHFGTIAAPGNARPGGADAGTDGLVHLDRPVTPVIPCLQS